MMNTEMQNFQQKKWKGDNDLTLVIFDVVNHGKNVTGAIRQKTAVFGMTRHVLHGALDAPFVNDSGRY